MIATYVGADHREWDLHVHEFHHAMNTATQSSTKVYPAFLNFGRHPKPIKSLRREVEGPIKIEKIDPTTWADRVRRLDALRDLVSRHIDRTQEQQERYYNRGKRNAQFSVGDEVISYRDERISYQTRAENTTRSSRRNMRDRS